MRIHVLFLLLLISVAVSAQKIQGLALTPSMGWSSMYKFGCNINEKTIEQIATAVITSGMKDAGYQYINIDDCWQIGRDGKGNILVDSVKFPSGIKALADYLHCKGLKLWLKTSAGQKTCSGKPGSYGFEEQDAKKYADWGIDYLNVDFCNSTGIDPKAEYLKLSNAITAAGRPIVFNIGEYGNYNPWYWAKDIAHSWRTAGDVLDCWGCDQTANSLDWVYILDKQEGLEKFAGPGHWNNLDILLAGSKGLKDNEYRAQFSFWCLLAAPLIASTDLRNMDDATKNILLNKEAIAVNQDALGKQGSKKRDDGPFEVWTKPLSGGDYAVVLFNRGFWAANVLVNADVKWNDLGIEGTYKVRDLWSKTDLGNLDGYKGSIPIHSVVFLRLIKTQ